MRQAQDSSLHITHGLEGAGLDPLNTNTVALSAQVASPIQMPVGAQLNTNRPRVTAALWYTFSGERRQT